MIQLIVIIVVVVVVGNEQNKQVYNVLGERIQSQS